VGGGPVRFEQTSVNPHYYELWGEASDMLAAVTRVSPAWFGLHGIANIMVYIIVDTDTAQQVGAYVTEAEAVADVRDAVKKFGRSYAVAWGLAEQDSGGSLRAIAEGDVLIDRALASLAAS
jgi:hypothetical protein